MSKILFVYQEANFCVRAGLIPAKEFLAVRSDDWKVIKESAELFQDIPVLWDEIVWQGRIGDHVQQPWSEVIWVMSQALEWGEEHVEPKDEIWASKIQSFHITSFEHVATYKRLAAKYKDQLIGGIAKLERDQGKEYRQPSFSNTKQLMDFYKFN